MAFGLPIGQANIKNLAMVTYTNPSMIVFAGQSELSPEQSEMITSGKLQQVQALIQKMGEEASASNQDKSNQFRSIRFNQMYKLNLAPNKAYTVCNATLEVERRGTVAYFPTSIALLPEENNNLVVLAAWNPNNSSTDPEAKFDNVQKSMQEQLLKVIHESELANRISVTGAGAAKPSRPQSASGQE